MEAIKTTMAESSLSWLARCPHCQRLQGIDLEQESRISDLVSEIGFDSPTSETCGVEYTCDEEDCGKKFEVLGVNHF